MHRENGIRIIAITLIAAGIAGYLIVAIAEATSYSVIQCVDYPAGVEAPNAGCHEVSNNTPQILKPFMNENFKSSVIFVSSVGAVILFTSLGCGCLNLLKLAVHQNCYIDVLKINIPQK